MAELNRAGRYDRLVDAMERVTGRLAMSVREFVSHHADAFGGRRSQVEFIDEHLPLPRVGLIDRSSQGCRCALRCDRPKHPRGHLASQCESACLSPSTRERLPLPVASVSSDRSGAPW
jgi:hypothetical protein